MSTSTPKSISLILVDTKKTAGDGSFSFTSADVDHSAAFRSLGQAARPNAGWVNFNVSGMVPGGVGVLNGLHFVSFFRYAHYHESPYAPFYWCSGTFVQGTGWVGSLDRGTGFDTTRDGICQFYSQHLPHAIGTEDRSSSHGFHYNLAVNVFGVELGGSSGYTVRCKVSLSA